MIPKREFDPLAVAFELGDAAVNQAVDRLECVRGLEKCRRQDINAAEITSLSAALALRTSERDEIREAIRRMPQPELAPHRSRLWYVAVAIVLAVAGFSFAHLALAPFGLGWQVWPYSVALAVVCAYATDETLEKCSSRRLITVAAVATLLTSLGGLLLMALVRGDVLALYLRNAMAAGPGDPSAGYGADAVRFYETAAPRLQLFFALLAVAMELATGLAIHEARRIPGLPPDALAPLEARLRLLEDEMVSMLHRLEFLKREADIFENEFTRDFYLGLIGGARSRSSKYLGLVLAVALCLGLLRTPVAAAEMDLVVGLDLSLTSAARNYDGSMEHAKNIEGAVRLVEGLPAGTRIRVVGITDRSFSRPLILLSGAMPTDRGTLEFIDRVAVARQRLVADTRTLGRAAPPKYRDTDVIGFLIVAADLFRDRVGTHKALVIFSDMRHSAPPPDIETPQVVPISSALRTVERQNQIADLHNVEVYVYGVHAAEKNFSYWQSLRAFWTQYFAKSGAALKSFSMMRDVPDFGHLQGQ